MTSPSDFTQANTLMLQTYAALALAAKTEAEQALVDQLATILAGSVPPEKVSHFFEFGYARRADLPAELLPAFADVGNFAWSLGFYGLSVDSRGALMESVLRGLDLPEGAMEPVPSQTFAAA